MMKNYFQLLSQHFPEHFVDHSRICLSFHGFHRLSDQCTECFFCHFAISCVLLSHLWNVSPFVLWHGLVLAPTSVTEVVTEEREQGIAYFRGTKVGDISHLYAGGEEPAFAARFCEVYSNEDQRH